MGPFSSAWQPTAYFTLPILLNFFKMLPTLSPQYPYYKLPSSRRILSTWQPQLPPQPYGTNMATTTTSTEDRALSLLGQGLGPEVVAAAVGVSTSRISQLLSTPEFSQKVAELRYESLAKHNQRDNAYDKMEDSLLEKLKDCLPFMMRPMEILKAIQVINAAKRRGSSAPESITAQQTVVQLVMPTQILQSFTTNINNQVIKAGQQDLVTVQSSNMDKLLEGVKNVRNANQSGGSLAGPSA